MSLKYIRDYSETIANMKKVLSVEPQVYVDKHFIDNIHDARIIADDLNLKVEFNVVDERFYFNENLQAVKDV